MNSFNTFTPGMATDLLRVATAFALPAAMVDCGHIIGVAIARDGDGRYALTLTFDKPMANGNPQLTYTYADGQWSERYDDAWPTLADWQRVIPGSRYF